MKGPYQPDALMNHLLTDLDIMNQVLVIIKDVLNDGVLFVGLSRLRGSKL